MFLISKIKEFFFLYIPKKRYFENRKQKLFPNIPLFFGIEKKKQFLYFLNKKHVWLVEIKKKKIVSFTNMLLLNRKY